MKPELTSNMQDYISSGSSNKITFCGSSILYPVDDSNIKLGFHNIIDDYMDQIKPICKTLELSNSQLNKYRFKPSLLSYDIYGTTDLEFLILKLNNMVTAKDFDKKSIKILDISGLEMINSIYNAEKKYIRMNRNSL